MARRISTRALTICCVACVIIGYTFLWINSDSWYTGPDITPNEENRVFHPAGFSIIAPAGWQNRVTEADGAIDGVYERPTHANDSIRIIPNTKARLTEMLIIRKIGGNWRNQDIRTATPAKQDRFQLPAAATFEEQRGNYWVWFALLPDQQSQEHYYELSLWLPNDDIGGQDSVPEVWWSYLNSFRMELPEAGSK